MGKVPLAMWVGRAAKEGARECIGVATALRSRIELCGRCERCNGGASTGKEVPAEEIVKGYEVEKKAQRDRMARPKQCGDALNAITYKAAKTKKNGNSSRLDLGSA
jgi:hypothetical protein